MNNDDTDEVVHTCFISIPLPKWVLEEMDKDQDLAYTDRSGRRNYEYVSLGCDALPVLKGRTPIQCYADFMRAFRDHFADYLGNTIVVRRALALRRAQTITLLSLCLPDLCENICRKSKSAWAPPASCATRPTRRATAPGGSPASAPSNATTGYGLRGLTVEINDPSIGHRIDSAKKNEETSDKHDCLE